MISLENWGIAKVAGPRNVARITTVSDIKSIDLNADVGEECGQDAALMRCITSANVACGVHAGSPATMRETVRLARDNGVGVGAHPSFPDREHFGRRHMQLRSPEIGDLVIRQIEALAAVASNEGIRLLHVKPHGALYNVAVRDRRVADAIAQAVVSIDRSLVLLGLPRSELVAAAQAVGLQTAGEAFADRAYRADGTLVPRTEPGAVIQDPEEVLARVAGLASRPDVETICVHGDTPGAAELASKIRAALEAAKFEVKNLSLPRFRDQRAP
jgi:5-oxoprolinase (ATP-hydrolysing) subunit A